MLIDAATLTPRARHRIAIADPAILRFAAMQPGGIRAWAEGRERDGHGRPVSDAEPLPADDDLVSIGIGRL